MAIVNKVNIMKLTEFAPSVKHQLNEKHQDVVGGVFKSTNCSWLACGSNLTVVSNADASMRTSWSFGNIDDNSDITCVAELPVDKCQIPLIIVGISSDKSSKICIFNPNTRKVIRTVQLDIQVRCVSVVDNGVTTNVHPLPAVFDRMRGVLAIGGADGSLILADLNRDIIVRAVEGDLLCESDECNPHDMHLVRLDEIESAPLLDIESGDSLGIVLIDGYDNEDYGITAVEYSKEIACLYIGLGSGSWEVWNLITFKQLFCSPESEFPIFGFAQLEPCDDPRPTVYVWVTCQAPSQSLPLASLYSISFIRKDFIDGFGMFYEGFEQCGLVFEMSPGEEVDGVKIAKIVSVETISKTIKSSNTVIGLPDSDDIQIRLAATFYTIESRSTTETRLLLFDLNRWYAEQMPSSIEETSVQLTRSGVVRTLLDVSVVCGNHLISAKLLQDTVDAFTNAGFEIGCGHISLELVGINAEGVLQTEKLGAQRQWLRNSQIAGSRVLIHPQQLYRACLSSGIPVVFSDYFDFDNPSVEEMRSYILSAWLEYKMFSCIMDCADTWSNGSHSVSGCTLSYLLDWLWGQLVHCKSVAHHLCRTLFDASGTDFDLSERKKLQNCKTLIHSIHLLYSQIVQKHSKFILIENAESKLRAISLLSLYIDQVVFFLYLGVLPEQNHLGAPRSSIAYDSVRLQKFVSQRNLYLIRTLDECKKTKPHVLPPEEGLYMVDSFNFTNEGIKFIDYPPQSVQILLRVWLKLEPSIANKFSISYYFLLDLMHICEDDKYHACMDKISNYPFTLGMSNSQVSVVKALWHLDHSFYEDGIKLLLSPQVLATDITDTQNRCILRLLFIETKYNLALQYLKTKQPALHLPDDIKFEMSLLIANQLINEAHLFQRRYTNLRDDLLMQFFAEQDFNQLVRMLNLCLNEKEEKLFMNFLDQQKNPKYTDLKIMFLTSRAKYSEVIDFHKKHGSMSGPNGISTRDRFVQGISSCLHHFNGNLNPDEAIVKKHQALLKAGAKPLSVYVKTSLDQGFPAPQISDKAVAAYAMMCVKSSFNQQPAATGLLGSRHGGSNGSRDILHISKPATREITSIQRWPAPPTPQNRKRFRSDDLAANLIVRHDKKKVKLDNNKVADERKLVETLLATPLIERRRPMRTPSSVPQSILKKTGDPRTPVKIDNARDTHVAEDMTPRKSIRFTLPEEETGDSLKSSLRVSARRSLRPLNNAEASDESMEAVEVSASSDSNSPSISSLDASKDYYKEVVSSTPLRSSLKQDNGGIDWKSIMDQAKPKTLFTIGASDSALRKLSKSTASTSTSTVGWSHIDGTSNETGVEKPLVASTKENNAKHPVEDGVQAAEEVETPKTGNSGVIVTPKEKNPKNAHRTRSATTLRSSKLVEDILVTPKTRLRKRIEEKMAEGADKKRDVVANENDYISSSNDTTTPTKRTKRVQMHLEKKISMDMEVVEDITDDDDDDDIEEADEIIEEECVTENVVEKKSRETCVETHQPPVEKLNVSSERETVVEVAEVRKVADVPEDVQTNEVRSKELNVSVIEHGVIDQVERHSDDDESPVGQEIDLKLTLSDDSDDLDEDVEELDISHENEVETECASLQNEELEEEEEPPVKISHIFSLKSNATIPGHNYHALTPVSDPTMLGAIAPAREYFTGSDTNDGEEDEDLYEDLEEAEIPPKMDFEQPEEGFGGIYEEEDEDVYEEEREVRARVASPKPEKSDSDSSVICLDSDSDSEEKRYSQPGNVNSTELDFEEELDEDTEDEESSSASGGSPHARSRSFFHDKFQRYSDSEEEVASDGSAYEFNFEDEEGYGEEEEEEAEKETNVKGDDEEDMDEAQEEAETGDDEDMEQAQEEVETGDDEDMEEADTEDEEQANAIKSIKKQSNEVEEESACSNQVPEEAQKGMETENDEPTSSVDQREIAETETLITAAEVTENLSEPPTLSKEPESSLILTENQENNPPELDKCPDAEIETSPEEAKEDLAKPEEAQQDLSKPEEAQEDFAKSEEAQEDLAKPDSVSDQTDQIDEICTTPVVEEVKDEAKDDATVAVVDPLASSSNRRASSTIDEQTLAALDLKRVEDVKVCESDIKLDCETQSHDVENQREKVENDDKEKVEEDIEEKKEIIDELENVIDKVDLSSNESANNASTTHQAEPAVSMATLTKDSRAQIVAVQSSKETQKKSSENQTSEENIPTDLFALGKGQMFFGSPADVKTSPSELATFQVGCVSIVDGKTAKEDGDGEKKSVKAAMLAPADVSSANDEEKSSTPSSMDYSVEVLDMAMIASGDSVGSTPCATPLTKKRKYGPGTPGDVLKTKIVDVDADGNDNDSITVVEKTLDTSLVKTPLTVSTKNRKYRPGTPGDMLKRKFVNVESGEKEVDEQASDDPELKSTSRQNLPQHDDESETEKLEKFKKLVDRSMITEPVNVIESSLDYLELCIPCDNDPGEGSRRRRSSAAVALLQRNRRATSEQPQQKKVSFGGSGSCSTSTSTDPSQRKHYRRSLNVARIYSNKRESMKRDRTVDEEAKTCSTAADIRTGQSMAADQEESQHQKRPRRSSCSHKDLAETQLGEHQKLKSVETRKQQCSDEAKLMAVDHQAFADVDEEQKLKMKRRSRKSSMLTVSPPLQPIVEEETPKSIAKNDVKSHHTSGPLAKKWKPSRLDFSLLLDDADSSIELSSKASFSTTTQRSGKARSLPAVSPRRSSARLQCALPSVHEVQEEEEEVATEQGGQVKSTKKAVKSSRSKRLSTAASGSSNLQTETMSVEQQPSNESLEKFNEAVGKKKPSSLPDLSRKRRSSMSGRPAVLCKLPEEEEEEEKEAAASSSGSCPPSTRNTSSVKMATNAAFWAEKMFGEGQAKWWKRQMIGKASLNVVDSSSSIQSQPAATSVVSSPGANTRSKTSAPAIDSATSELLNRSLTNRKKKDAETESIKSDRSVRSSRSRKEDSPSVKSEKIAKTSRRKKDVETSSVTSERSTRSTKKEGEVFSPASDKSNRSIKRKKDVETSSVTSERSTRSTRKDGEVFSPASDKSNRSINRRKTEVEMLLDTPMVEARSRRPKPEDTSSTSSEQSHKKRVRERKEKPSQSTALQKSGSEDGDASLMDSSESEMNRDVTTLVEEYAEHRRLTRHQKSLLERSFSTDTHYGSHNQSRTKPKETDKADSDDEPIFTPVNMEKYRRRK